MKKILKISLSIFLLLTILSTFLVNSNIVLADELPYIILSHYYKNMDIGDKLYLTTFTSNGKLPTFKSSNSKIASVNRYGLVTAKKAGNAAITARINNCIASCVITVNPTIIKLDTYELSLENNQSYRLIAQTSNKSPVKWKSNKKSIAYVDDNGNVTAKKPGSTTITATADGYSVSCKVLVKKPSIALNMESLSLYKNQSFRLLATISSGIQPKWKSSRSSVASVDSTGYVSAHKNGTATITVSADGTSKTCKVTVLKPKITIPSSVMALKAGQRKKLTVTVSSGNVPEFRSSNSNVATVSPTGCVTGIKKGTAIITICEDGTKIKCKITVL